MLRPRSVSFVLLWCSIGTLMLMLMLMVWSGNEAAMDVAADYWQEIRGVLAAVRRSVASEMDGYLYPGGLNGVTARSLEDLVPALGGQPIRSLIVTTWRSGSTFLGELLNSHPANFYHYEPLHGYGLVRRIREEPLASEAVGTLRALFNCNYTGLDQYLADAKRENWSFKHNTRLWERCLQKPPLCWLPEFLNPFCRLFPFQSAKTVRLKLGVAEGLLADESLDVRVLLLVRDPRGILQSRKHCPWCAGNPDCSDARVLCSDLVADYASAKQLAEKYPDRFTVVRYEDLAVTPYRTAKELFKFLGLDFHPNVQEFLDSHTKVNVGSTYSTYRDSKSAPFQWRKDLSHVEVRAIQQHCKQAMDAWGYLEAFNSTHQREFHPVSEYKFT